MNKPTIVVSAGSKGALTYLQRLVDAGAAPKEVRPGSEIPTEFDGLCLTGGPDVHWSRYGAAWNGSEEPDLPRDALELDSLLPAAWRRACPILAICRGVQVLNVFRGGTLLQDIGEAHRAKGDDVKPHQVVIDPSSHLARISGTLVTVNSRHHQVLDRIGAGLRPAGLIDGYVEAVEGTSRAWVVGVQWHPERSSEVDEASRRIFQAFVSATAER